MSRHLDTPVGSLPGLGPAAATRLRRAGLSVIGDLLRVSSPQLRSILGDRAKPSDVRRWLSTAALLQVEGLSPAAARALAGSGVVSVEGLQARSFEALADLFERARRAGVIRRAPKAAEVATILRDATVIWHCGAITGTVRAPDGKPARGVQVSCGPATTMTSTRGRFRLLRVPLRSRRRVLLLRDARHGTTIVEPAPVVADPRAVRIVSLALSAARRSPMEGGAVPPGVVLRERDGDRLPPFAGMPCREERIELSDADSRDLFVLRRLAPKAREADLVSRFRAFGDGEFIVTVCRISRRHLPRDARPGDHYRLEAGRLVRVRVSAAGMVFRRRLRQVTRELARRPSPRTPMEREAAMRAVSARLRAATSLHRRKA